MNPNFWTTVIWFLSFNSVRFVQATCNPWPNSWSNFKAVSLSSALMESSRPLIMSAASVASAAGGGALAFAPSAIMTRINWIEPRLDDCQTATSNNKQQWQLAWHLTSQYALPFLIQPSNFKLQEILNSTQMFNVTVCPQAHSLTVYYFSSQWSFATCHSTVSSAKFTCVRLCSGTAQILNQIH